MVKINVDLSFGDYCFSGDIWCEKEDINDAIKNLEDELESNNVIMKVAYILNGSDEDGNN